MQKVALVNSTANALKKHRLRDRTDRAWFSHLLWHPARKRSGSILTTPEPAWGRDTEKGCQKPVLQQKTTDDDDDDDDDDKHSRDLKHLPRQLILQNLYSFPPIQQWLKFLLKIHGFAS